MDELVPGQIGLPNSSLYILPADLASHADNRMTNDDLKKFSEALNESAISDLEWFGRMGLEFSVGEMQNIKSDCNQNRSNMIMKMVQKWCENSQECATPSRLISILDKMKLNQVKHWWWSLYFDDNRTTCHHQFLKERKVLFRRIADQDKSENAWIELVVKLSLTNQWETACRKYPDNQKMQRLFVLDQWTLEKGYNDASNDLLRQEWEALQRVSSQPCINTTISLSNIDGDNGAVALPSSSIVKFDIGLFFHRQDQSIATRIENALTQSNYKVCNFDNFPYPGGIAKAKKSSFFSENCMCVFWIATHLSSNCEGYPREHRDLLNHTSIVSESEKGAKNFVVLIPNEFLNNRPKLPPQFDAYDALPEDERFLDRVKATVGRIKNKCNRKSASKSFAVTNV